MTDWDRETGKAETGTYVPLVCDTAASTCNLTGTLDPSSLATQIKNQTYLLPSWNLASQTEQSDESSVESELLALVHIDALEVDALGE